MPRDIKIFKMAEKTAVYFFPECEKVNNHFTKKMPLEYFDESEISELPKYFDDLEYSDVSEYS